MRPEREPIGLGVARTGRMLSRAFDDALVAAGGSLHVADRHGLERWEHAMQRDIAGAIGSRTPP